MPHISQRGQTLTRGTHQVLGPLSRHRVTACSYFTGPCPSPPGGLGFLGAAGLGALKAPPTRWESSGPLGAAPLEPELLASPQQLLEAPSPLACVSGIPTKQW